MKKYMLRRDKMRSIKYCTSTKPYCNARIKQGRYSLCCRYGWCAYAQSSQDRKHKAVRREVI